MLNGSLYLQMIAKLNMSTLPQPAKYLQTAFLLSALLFFAGCSPQSEAFESYPAQTADDTEFVSIPEEKNPVTSETSAPQIDEDISVDAPVAKSYQFDQPDVSIKLPKELKEISGLTLLDGEHLMAVQDEKGKLYTVRIADGKIVEEKRFGKDGDFEGIERAGDDLYTLRSDGDIYEIKKWKSDDPKSDKFETHLSTRFDTEGLGYDAANNRLLVVCKEFPGEGLKNSRTIYAFDLGTETMSETPVVVINLKEIENMTPDHPLNRAIRNLASPLRDLSGFKPAALAVHPITNQIFVVSSVRKIMLALSAQGALENLWTLPEDLFRQPEGLAFMPNGDLFISNEGGNGRATLLRFNYK